MQRTHGSKKLAQYLKIGHNLNAVPGEVQPGTYQDQGNYGYIKDGSGVVYLPISRNVLESDPTKDLEFIRRNGVTPVMADNGVLTANIEFLTRTPKALGFLGQQSVVDFSLGPDVSVVGVPGLGSIVHSVVDIAGVGIAGQMLTDNNGLFRVTITFAGAGSKLLMLKYLNETYAVAVAVA